MLLTPTVQAESYCDPSDLNTQYKSVYCSMHVDNNKKADDEVVKIVAKQFDLDEAVVEGILSGTVCDTLAVLLSVKSLQTIPDDQLPQKLKELEELKVPENIKNACLPERLTVDQQLLAQNVLIDVKNTYQKEKAMLLNSMALKYKFEAAESYWSGKVGIVDMAQGNAPFDLIVDLNLIEIVLFGSKAQWMNDVFSFPDQDDEEGDDEDVPVDITPEEEEGEGEGDGILDGDGGISQDETKGDIPPDCVPPDHPDADPDAGGDDSNLLCGDGNLDVLLGEQCDDGNKKSGDGCNQYCQTEAAGSSDICADPEAVTFKEPGEDGNGDGDGDNECPDGYVPRIPDVSGEGAGDAPEVAQHDGYPGPFIGGTLKQFGESPRPACPQGYSEWETKGGGLSAEGDETFGINIAGKQYDVPRCLPTEFCADPDAVRTFLAATALPFPIGPVVASEWQSLDEDHPVRQSLEAIEAIFCVNVIKNNRPLSPYSMIEGCVDCHITAMVDALEQALQTNVSPLENTTSSFGISSKFGPNFSFNLMTATKKKLKFKNTGTASASIQTASREFDEVDKENSPKDLTIPTPETPAEKIAKKEALKQKRLDATRDAAEQYNWSSGAISDIEMGMRVIPLLNQMQSSFENIQAKYEGIISATALNEKKVCEP